MKRKNIKKRLAALRSGLMLSLYVISPFSYYKAMSGGAYFTNNEWGSVSYGVIGETVLNTTYNAMGWIYAMNGVYNGRVNINFTNTFGTNTLIIPYNCTIESKGTQSLTISWKNVQEVGLIFMDMTSNYALSIQSMYGWNMTKISNGTNNQLEDIKTQLGTIVTAVNNSYSQLTSIHNDTDQILSLLQSYFTSSGGTNINIGDIVLQFNEFNAQLRLQLQAINNIDNKIDTITWLNHTQFNFQKASSIGGTLSNFVADANLGNTIYVYIPTSIILNNDYLYHFHFPIYTTNYTNFNITAEIYDNLGYKVNGVTYIEVRNSRNVDVYVHPELTSSGRANYIKVSCSAIMFGNGYGENSSFYEMLPASDVEFYTLLQYFKNYQFQKDILTKLSTLNTYDYNNKLDQILTAISQININQTTTNEQNTIIESYQDTINDIDVVINNNIDVFTDNMDSILNGVDTINSFLNPAQNALRYVRENIFINDWGNIYSNWLGIMLFATLVIVMLG